MANNRSEKPFEHTESGRLSPVESAPEGEEATASPCLADSEKQERSTLDEAVRSYELRRVRDRVFEDLSIFGEPPWDMLLYLYIHEAREQLVSVDQLIIGLAASKTMASRWLKALENAGLIRTTDCGPEGCLRRVSLTTDGYERMTRCLSHLPV